MMILAVFLAVILYLVTLAIILFVIARTTSNLED